MKENDIGRQEDRKQRQRERMIESDRRKKNL
jgi:hypothetical protein